MSVQYVVTKAIAAPLGISFHPRGGGGGGALPYEEYTGLCHELGSYYQEKIPKRLCQFFTKIPERAVMSVRNSR